MDRADVVLVYPQRAPTKGRHWIMPSLGLMYLSAALRRAGYSVRHIDHTFRERADVLAEIESLPPADPGDQVPPLRGGAGGPTSQIRPGG